MKNTSPTHNYLSVIGSSILLGASSLVGQESQEAATDLGDLSPLSVKSEKGEEDKVSAFLTDTPLRDIPQSLSVVTEEEIKDRGYQSLGDIVDYTPGVINSQGEGHRDAIVFRGQPRSTADFFVDGIRDDVQYYRSLYNVEKVEFLRGPNALFFGRGGSGGVINRVLKKPILGDQFGSISGDVDTFGAFGTQFDYNRQTSDNTAFRLNLFYESLENHRDFYDGDRIGINPTFLWQISETTSLDFSYEYSDHERFIDRGIPVGDNGKPVDRFNGTVFGDSELNETTLDAHTLRATLNHEFSDAWKGRASAFYGTYDKVYTNYYASGYDQASDLVEIDGYRDSTDRETFSLTADVVGEFTTGQVDHKMVIGADYIRTSSDQNRFNNVWASGGNGDGPDQQDFAARGFRMSNGAVFDSSGAVIDTGSFISIADDTRVTVDSYSLFIHDEISINEQWDVILGARFDSFDIDVYNAVANETRTRKDQEISPRFGLVYKPQEELSFYASYSESFLPRSGEQFTDINGDKDALEPDTFTNLELGAKWDVTDDSFLTFAVFQIEQSSPQVADSDPSTLDVIDTETFGIELQYQGRIMDWWYINAGYTYLDGEQLDRSGDTGLDPREQPEHLFSVWNNFIVNDKFGFGLGMLYQDSSFADSGNTATLPSFVRFDASAYYLLDDSTRIQLNIENLLDREYYPNSHSGTNISVGAPISARLMISKSF